MNEEIKQQEVNNKTEKNKQNNKYIYFDKKYIR